MCIFEQYLAETRGVEEEYRVPQWDDDICPKCGRDSADCGEDCSVCNPESDRPEER